MNTTVTFRTNEKLKKEATKVFNSLGINLSTALNIFMRQAVIKQGFPCNVDLDSKIDPKSTYPEGFFEMFEGTKNLGFPEEIQDLNNYGEDLEF